MAVLIEAISVVARRPAIARRFRGGWPAFQQIIPNSTACVDNDLVRVGFMTPADVEAFVAELEAGGLIFRHEGEAVDVAVVDQLHGLTVAAPWLQVTRIRRGEKNYVAAALVGQDFADVAVPHGWEFDGSLSERAGFVANGTEGDRLKFLRHENDIDVYLDLITGKEVFVGRPLIDGETEAALFTRLKKFCHDALNIGAESEPLKALGDMETAAPLFEALQDKLLPETEEIVMGIGQRMAFAHFTHETL